MKSTVFLIPAIVVAVSSTAVQADEITGAGATFPAPVYAKWAEAYRAKNGSLVNYQSIGSGAGIKQIKVKTVDFGATDAPMKKRGLKKRQLLQFPAIIGGIVPVLNIKGVKPGQLKLDGFTLASIFSGEISQWDAPEIAKLNPGLALPAKPITVVYRSDSSGTTSAFTKYLTQTKPSFKDLVGAGKTVKWRTGIGGKGNAGVAANVLKLKNAIGYVEYAYAKQNKMSYATMINKAGNPVAPNEKTFAAAAADADWSAKPGFGISLSNQAGKNAWPITAASFILMYKKPENPGQSTAVLKFFNWAFGPEGQKLALDLAYVPLPPATVQLVRDAWQKILDGAGKPVLPL